MSARCYFLYLLACTSHRDEQGCHVLSTGGRQSWERRFLELGLLPLPCTCACLFTLLTATRVCVPRSYTHSVKCLHAGSWLWSPAVGHGRACMAERQLRAVPLPPCAPAQPPLQLGRGRRGSPELAPGTAGSHCHAQGWGARAWGPGAAAHEHLFR